MRPVFRFRVLCLFTALTLAAQLGHADDPPPAAGSETEAKPTQVDAAPDRNEGDGPYSQLILRGATLIDGTGSPPVGPVDIVIEGNQIADVNVVGYPGIEPDPERRPTLAANGREIDLEGQPKGIYFLVVETDGQRAIRKLVLN